MRFRVQPTAKLVGPSTCATSTPLRLLLGQALRDDPRTIRQVIDRQHDIVQSDRQRWYREFIESRTSDAFQTAMQVIAQQPRRSALERRQIVLSLGAITIQPNRQFGQRVLTIRRDFQILERIGGQE